MKSLSMKVTALSLVVFLASCGGDDTASPQPKPQPQAATTVMVYMLGSDLESGRGNDEAGRNATKNLEEMLKATLPPNANIVIETGGANVVNDPTRLVPNWINVKRHVIANGKLQQVADLGKVDMGAPSTLSDFIAWTKSKYPAGNYKLLLWDHGGGWTGYGGDENFNRSQMTLPNLSKAIADGEKAANIRFDLIGFDACLMATVEVASALSPYADYLLASQELEPGSGWNWTTVVASATQDARTFGKSVADSYIEKQDGEREFSTLSLIDLSKIANVQTTLESWTGTVLSAISGSDDSWARVAWMRATSLGFGGNGSGTDSNPSLDLVDLKQFSRNIADKVQGSVALANAISQAVVYSNTSANYSSASGLSVYFPSRSFISGATQSQYQAIDFSPKYRDFTSKYIAAIASKPHISDINAVVRGGAITGSVSSDAGILSLDNLLFSNVGTDGTATLVGSIPLREISGFSASQSFNVPLSGDWPTLDGYPVILGYLYADDNNKYWGVPIELNGELTYLLYQLNDDPADAAPQWTAVGTTSSLSDRVPRLMPLPAADDKVRILAVKLDTTTGRATDLVPATPVFSLANFDLQLAPVHGSLSQALMATDSTWNVKLTDIYPRNP
ncbi:clostripain-related cysteine peptidase [Burkholderia cenocepacia]|uniref:clostripain-related cysteine peptidase n=1 Tax=Burkholderia cenocepacia TaxID=95486 RepID=UPI0021AB3F9A|nr:clostripain-related cysteine peptidase [Burkholderia cenocepacia]